VLTYEEDDHHHHDNETHHRHKVATVHIDLENSSLPTDTTSPEVKGSLAAQAPVDTVISIVSNDLGPEEAKEVVLDYTKMYYPNGELRPQELVLKLSLLVPDDLR
jgi:hypothetical protein